jgi:Zn-dependent protease
MYQDSIRIPRSHGRIRFSQTERRHILIAVLVLTIAFAIFFRPIVISVVGGEWEALGYSFLISALAVLTGFMGHELAHKFMAQRYGAWAEFRMYPFGLLLALIFSFFGFIFAAPGAVYIQGMIDRDQNARISFAGPSANLIIGGITVMAWALLPVGGLLGLGLRLVGLVNVFLAAFNLLPIPPMDGSKIFRWNPILYAAAMAASVLLLLLAWGLI